MNLYKKSCKWCRKNAEKVFKSAQQQLQKYTKTDPNVVRKDTAKGLVKILSELKDALKYMNHGTMRDKEANFILVYNGTIYIYDIC